MEQSRAGFFLPKRWKLILLILTLLILFFGGTYIENFATAGLSPNPEHWGAFADYFGLMINILNVAAVLFLGYQVHNSQNERDRWEMKYLALQETPILRFALTDAKIFRLYNVGKSAAHNIIIGMVPFGENDIEPSTVHGYSLPAGAFIDLGWTSVAWKLYVCYENIEGYESLVRCFDNRNENIQENHTTENRNELLKKLKENPTWRKITIRTIQ